jgi:hypothetical protein
MTQLTIVTTPTNSGDGTPLATAFNYCNSNFNELYARYQVDPPVSLIGTTGDVPGMYAVDATYFYYCFDAYDGVSTIWGQVTQVGNITVAAISGGTSNVKIADVNGNATTSIGGIANVVVVSTTGQYVTGLISATGNIRGNYILGNGSQLTGLPATYTNANVVSLLSAFGSNTISTTGNVTSGLVSATGNVSGGNLTTGGQVSATGNIVTDQYFVGNFFGNITGNFVVPGSNTQVIYNTSGNADASSGFTFNTAGPNLLTVLGTISSSGNIQAGNLRTAGLVSATGNITGGNLSGTNIVGTLTTAAQNNITSVGTLSSLTVTANVAGGNITTGGQVSATGNIRTSNYLFVGQDINVAGDITATSYTGNSLSLSGNVTGGNIRTGGLISATGNITGNYIIGNGSQLTSLVTNTIQNGNSNVLVGSSAGNVSINVNGIAPLAIFTPLGQTTTGIISATGTVTAGNVSTGGNVSAAGNITGNVGIFRGTVGSGAEAFFIGTTGYTDLNSNVILQITGNANSYTQINFQNINAGNRATTDYIATAEFGTDSTYFVDMGIAGGNYDPTNPNNSLGNSLYPQDSYLYAMGGNSYGGSGGNLVVGSNEPCGVVRIIADGSFTNNIVATFSNTGIAVKGNIVNSNANGVGNIGSSTGYFNTVFATATSAQYADLAENYLADAEYAPGTVVIFGGEQEITVTTEAADERVAGVISTNPAYLMNSGELGLPVALRGKVPVRVVGPVAKGDSLVTSTTPGVAFSVGRERVYGQAIFAKSLESNNSDGEKVILAVII